MHVALMLDACLNSWQANGYGWGMGYLWRSMRWLSRVDVGLLALMLVNTLVIICQRVYGHSAARRQSCTFVRDAAAALRDGKFDNVISIAARNSRSHVATLIAAGLTAFASAPPEFTDIEAIDAAQRAFQCSRKMFAADLKLGIGTLSTFAAFVRQTDEREAQTWAMVGSGSI